MASWGRRDPWRKPCGSRAVLGPDVLAIGSGLLRGSALPTIRKLRARQPTTRVLVLTDPGYREPLEEFIEAGVTGCIGKDRTVGDLVVAVDLVAAGRMRLPQQASRPVQRQIGNDGSGLEARLAKLSEKECKVLALTARGFTAREIGVQIHLAPKSVDNYRSAIRRKLGITTRAELVSVALEKGFLETDLSLST